MVIDDSICTSGRRPVRAVEFRRGPTAGSAGDGRGKVQECPRPDLGRNLVERRPAAAVGGALGWWPRRCVFRRGGGSMEWVSRTTSTSRRVRGRGCLRGAVRLAGPEFAADAPNGAGGGSGDGLGVPARRGQGNRPFIGDPRASLRPAGR
jgi:hypothetical protein